MNRNPQHMGDWLELTLNGKYEDVLSSKDFLKQHDIIGLYFCAKWCEPCREFQDKLSVLYQYIKAGDTLTFGVIAVTDQADEEEYVQYASSLPWPTLPFSDLKSTAKLKRKYNVTSLPKLVIIESRTGKVLNHDAKADVENDLKGERFPWMEPLVSELLKGEFFVNGTLKTISDELIKQKTLGFYFSADWCPPCRKFTPELVEVHSAIKENGFEVIYCGVDKVSEKHNQCTRDMPWFVLPWKDPRIKLLRKIFQVEDIPQLVMWDCKTNEVINKNAISRIKLDPAGQEYPWKPENLVVLTRDTVVEMSRSVAFLYITESPEVSACFKDVRDIADKVADEFRFYIASDEDHVVSELRDILQIGDQCPYLLFLDFEAKKLARCLNKTPLPGDIPDFVEVVRSGSAQLTPFPSY